MKFRNYLIVEKTSKPIAIFIGRMQPLTVAHWQIIRDAERKYEKVYIVIIEGEASSKLEKNFLTFQDRGDMLKATSLKAKPILAKIGYIPDIISNNRIDISNGIVIIAGTDRIDGYKNQFTDVDYDVKFVEIKRTTKDVSAGKVRDTLVNNNYGAYKKMIAPGLDNKKWFELLKRAFNIKKAEFLESKGINIPRLTMFLKEGGHAIKGVVPINQENAKETLDRALKTILPLLNISENDIYVAGSLMKKLTPSGDIDILINIPSIIQNNENVNTIEDLYSFVFRQAKKVSSNSVYNKGIGVVSIPFPIVNIDGKQEGLAVQVDLMPTDDLNWSKFAYHTPYYYESKWKAFYRIILLTSCIKFATMNITKWDISGKPIEWNKILFNVNKGLMWVKQAIDQKGKVREIERKFFSFNPEEVTNLFGKNVKESDLNSFESIMNVIQRNDYPHKNRLNDILSDAAKGIKNMGFTVPDELEKYL